jgi:hypothetical protein
VFHNAIVMPPARTARRILGSGVVSVCSSVRSPRPPYIGQQMRSVPRLLVGYDQETKVYVTHVAISCRSALVEIHRGLVLYAKSLGHDELGRQGNLLEGLQEVVWAAN